MVRRALQIIGIAVIAGAIVFMIMVLTDRDSTPPAQNSNNTLPASEQNNGDGTENTTVQPDVNKQAFYLTIANLSCSSATMDGVSSRSCSGNIRAVPQAQSDMQPGVYKINEHTKLLHNGREQDLSLLQQLAQNNTLVRLKLASNSSETLSEIRY